MKKKTITRIIWAVVIITIDTLCGISWYNNGCNAKDISLGVIAFTAMIGALWVCNENWSKKD